MFESNEINKRISQKITIYEASALIFVFIMALYFLFTNSGSYWDYKVFLLTAQGDFENYYYGYWLLPIFKALSYLPFNISYLFWILLNVSGVVFAARVFNGICTAALLSYQMSFTLFWGQISGIICGFLGLFWWAIHHKKWALAGFAMLMVAAKPQTGGMFVLLLWVMAKVKWKQKLFVLIVPFCGLVLSLVSYPGWIMGVISRMDGLITWGNISLWQWIGPYALILFLPLLIIPLSDQKRFFALISAGILTIPYFLQTDLLTLFVFPVGIIPILLGYLPAIMVPFMGYDGQHSGFIVPLFVYFWILIPEIRIWNNSRKLKNQPE